jgi:alpha-mannosidase
LILEHDVGDPWATRSLDRTRERLAPYTKLRGIERGGDRVVIRYAGRHPASDNPHTCADPHVTILVWEQDFILRRGVPWVEVVTRVEWYTHSRRLRLAFPSTSDSDRGLYEIPYGVLARDRYEGSSINGGNAGGDWPALHWAGVEAPGHTLAVFNQGTPSYRVEAGVVLVSVLRSPQLPYGLYEPESYVANNFHGMSDHGTHIFHHAIYPAAGDSILTELTRQSALFNGGLLALPGELRTPLPVWEISAAHTNLTTVKTAEDGHGVILRLVECAGKSDVVRLAPPAGFCKAHICTLLEDAGMPLQPENGAFSIPLEPWKIVTVRLTGE